MKLFLDSISLPFAFAVCPHSALLQYGLVRDTVRNTKCDGTRQLSLYATRTVMSLLACPLFAPVEKKAGLPKTHSSVLLGSSPAFLLVEEEHEYNTLLWLDEIPTKENIHIEAAHLVLNMAIPFRCDKSSGIPCSYWLPSLPHPCPQDTLFYQIFVLELP